MIDPDEPIRLLDPRVSLAVTAPRDLLIAVLVVAILAVLAVATGVKL